MSTQFTKVSKIFIAGLVALAISVSLIYRGSKSQDHEPESANHLEQLQNQDNQGGIETDLHPLQIEYLRNLEYPGSPLVVEQTLTSFRNYNRYIVSYQSEGLKQFALLTIPLDEPPEEGWPAIVFNHGYIPPQQYATTERYVEYVNGFANNGFIVLKPDYRGHGNSEGEAAGGYGSSAYVIDVLNAFASLQQHPLVNSQRVGMWGHSMGGWITQRAMVVNPQIQAAVIWGGVVGSYQDLFSLWWNRRPTPTGGPSPLPSPGQRGYWRYQLFQLFGDIAENNPAWDSVSSTSYLKDLSGPIQLHHAKGDATVPYELSENFHQKLIAASQSAELFLYEGDNHNLSVNFSSAMSRSIEFFKNHL